MYYTRNAQKYTVKHYQENLDGTTYTEITEDEQTLTGTYGATITPSPNSYTGFTYVAGKTDPTGAVTVPADDNLVIKLYYDRIMYTVIFVDFDGTVLQTTQVPYGGSTNPPADPDNWPNHTFDRWTGGVWENVTANQTIRTIYIEIIPRTIITELGIPLAGGTVANVGDTFD